MRTILKSGVAAAVLALTAMTGQAAQAHPAADPAGRHAAGARVTGSAEFVLPFSPDDDVRKFVFDVRAAPYTRPLPGLPSGSPADATGTVAVSHMVAANHQTVTLEAVVDCLITSPGTATVTAIVTRADEPVRDWIGKRIGFSVYDGGRRGDRVGFTWALSGDQNDAGEWGPARIGTCVAPAPFAPVTHGDYTVRHADLTPPPA
jgi:hypothetical protein